MKYSTQREARAAFDAAAAFEAVTPSGRVIIYADHTDGAGLNARFWLCFQARVDAPCAYAVRGQLYLDKDGQWREPHGSASRRHFSTPAAAAKFAGRLVTRTQKEAA